MKKFFENFKSWLSIWLGFLVMVSVGGTIYATVNNVWTEPTQLEAVSWTMITSDSWNKILSNQKYISTLVAWLWEAPQNSVMAFASASCPSWWKAADWTNGTPDLRWVFIRWANDFWTWPNNRDLDRSTAWSWVLTYQEDAIRNITWRLGIEGWISTVISWAFYRTTVKNSVYQVASSTTPVSESIFDASRVVPTWNDNHPKNIALIYCVKQ